MKATAVRRDAIRSLVRGERVNRQSQIVDALRDMGHECSQGTISRDMRDLDLRKDGTGRYVLNEDMLLKRMLGDFVLRFRQAQNLVVIKTTSGTAQGVAAALDAADMAEALGTIAGDDTIFIATADVTQATALLEALKTLTGS